jgi:hypothetical protein
MTRLLALSHFLSHCHRLVSACHFGKCLALTARGLASHRNHKSPCLEGWNKQNPGEMVSSEACIAWWMEAFFVRKDGRAATSRRITEGLNGVCALRSNMSVSDINSSTKEGLILSAVDTSMSMCHPQR